MNCVSEGTLQCALTFESDAEIMEHIDSRKSAEISAKDQRFPHKIQLQRRERLQGYA